VPDGTLNVFARLKPEVSYGAAARQTTDEAGIDRLPDWRGKTGNRVAIDQLENINVSEMRTPLLALVGAVGFVLLIACANVANLQLERAVGRRRELAIRLAIGATRGRVLRQTLTETLLLYLIGGAAGAVAAMWTMHVIVGLLPAGVPHVDDVAVNARVLMVTLLFSCSAGIVVGLGPALTDASPRMLGHLKVSAPTGFRGGTWIRRGLVVAQVALSLTLLVGAGLMVRTFLTLRPTSPGFVARDKVTAFVRERSPSAVPPEMFFRRLLDRLAEIPGTQAVSGSTYLPMSGTVDMGSVTAAETTLSPWRGEVTPNYFGEMQIPIVRGRAFADADGPAAPPVAIVNETFAHRAWRDGDPIGATIITRARGGVGVTLRVVGLARDTRSLGGDLNTRPELYVPFAQEPGAYLNIIVRTSDPFDVRLPAEIRAAATELDPLQVVDRIRPLQAMLDEGVATPRFGAWLLGVFAAMAILLAAVGLAASIAWWVAQRTREIGVRMALGADAASVARLFVRQAVLLTATGIVLGLGGAAAATRLLSGWLYGVTPLDLPTFAGSAAGMLGIALLASYLPARRATLVDPLVTLKAE
jgi:putative ABC transport system permease protein